MRNDEVLYSVGDVAEVDVLGVDLFEVFCSRFLVAVCLAGEGELVPEAVIFGIAEIFGLERS